MILCCDDGSVISNSNEIHYHIAKKKRKKKETQRWKEFTNTNPLFRLVYFTGRLYSYTRIKVWRILFGLGRQHVTQHRSLKNVVTRENKNVDLIPRLVKWYVRVLSITNLYSKHLVYLYGMAEILKKWFVVRSRMYMW